MAKDKKEFEDSESDEIDTGFDELDDMDDIFESLGPDSKRSPVRRAAGGFLKGVLGSITSSDTQKSAIDKALPKQYSTAYGLANKALDTGKGLYDQARDQVKDSEKDLRYITRQVAGKTEGWAPNAIQKRLQELGKEKKDNEISSQEPTREEIVDQSIRDVFGKQRQEQLEAEERAHARDLALDAGNRSRHEGQMAQLDAIRVGVSRLVGYQDSVTEKYQRRSLELQEHQVRATRDIYKLLYGVSGEIVPQLEAISNNTALPDLVKTKTSESIKQRIYDKGVEKVGDFASRQLEGFRENLQERAKGLLSSGAGQLSSLRDMMSATEDMPIDKVTEGGSMAGGFITGKALPYGLQALRKIPGAERAVSRGADLIDIHGTQPGEALRGKLGQMRQTGEETDVGFGQRGLGKLAGYIEEMIPSYSPETYFGQDVVKNYGEPIPYTYKTDEAITEVIPSFLSRILEETESISTGTRAEREVWDPQQQKLRREKQLEDEIGEQVFPAERMQKLRGQMENVIKQLDPDGVLDDDSRQALMRQLLTDAAYGRHFDPLRYAKGEGLDAVKESDTRRQIQHVVSQKITGEGSDSEVKTRAKAINEFSSAREQIPSYQESIGQLMNLYGPQMLAQAGLVGEKGEKGQFTTDVNRILDSVTYGEDLRRDSKKPSPVLNRQTIDESTTDDGDNQVGASVGLNAVIEQIEAIDPTQRIDKSNYWLEEIYNVLSSDPGGPGGPKGPTPPRGPSANDDDVIRTSRLIDPIEQRANEIFSKLDERVSSIDDSLTRLNAANEEITQSQPEKVAVGAEDQLDLRSRIKGFGQKTQSSAKDLSSRVNAKVVDLKDRYSPDTTNIRNQVSTNVIGAKDKIVSGTTDVKERYSPNITGLKDRYNAKVIDARDRFGSKITDAKEQYSPDITDLKDRVSTTATDFKERISTGATNLKERYSPNISDLKDRVSTGATDTKDKIISGATDLRDRISSRFNKLREKDEESPREDEISEQQESKFNSLKSTLTSKFNSFNDSIRNLSVLQNKDDRDETSEQSVDSDQDEGRSNSLLDKGRGLLRRVRSSYRQTSDQEQSANDEIQQSSRLDKFKNVLNDKFSSLNQSISGFKSRYTESENTAKQEDPSKNAKKSYGFTSSSDEQSRHDEIVSEITKTRKDIVGQLANLSTGANATQQPGMMGKIMSGVGGGIGGAIKGTGKYYGKALSGMGSAVAGAGRGLGSVFGGVGKGIGSRLQSMLSPSEKGDAGTQDDEMVSDIYMKGYSRPVLKARDLKAGKYYDQESGEPIYSLEDIKSPVLDEEGNVILTDTEINEGNLYTSSGEPVKGIIGKVASGYFSYLKGTLGAPFKIIGSLYKKYKESEDKPRDVYVKGEQRPRLLALVMQNGGYFSRATGEPITSIKEIDGEVLDRDGNIVLSLDDLATGLIDSRGKSISDLSGKAGDLVGMGMKALGAYYKGVFKLGSKAAGAIGRKVSSLFGGSTESGAEGGVGGVDEVTKQAIIGTHTQTQQIANLLSGVLGNEDQGFGTSQRQYVSPQDQVEQNVQEQDAFDGDETKSYLRDIRNTNRSLDKRIKEMSDLLKNRIPEPENDREGRWQDMMDDDDEEDSDREHVSKFLADKDKGMLPGLGDLGGILGGVGGALGSAAGFAGDAYNVMSGRNRNRQDPNQQQNNQRRNQQNDQQQDDQRRNRNRGGRRGGKLGTALKVAGGIAGAMGLGGLFGGGGDGQQQGGGVNAGDAANAADVADSARNQGAKKGNWFTRAARSVGRGAKNLAKGARSLASRYGGTILRVGGRAALQIGARAIPAVAAAAGVISAPVVAVLGVVLLAATAAWLAYKLFSPGEASQLDVFRAAQYGFDVSKKSHEPGYTFAAALEQHLADHVQIDESTGEAKIGDSFDLGEFLEEDLEVDLEKLEDEGEPIEKMVEWMKMRFLPIYLTWVQQAHERFGITDLSELDDEFENDKQRGLFAKGTMFPAGYGAKVYSHLTPPVEMMEKDAGKDGVVKELLDYSFVSRAYTRLISNLDLSEAEEKALEEGYSEEVQKEKKRLAEKRKEKKEEQEKKAKEKTPDSDDKDTDKGSDEDGSGSKKEEKERDEDKDDVDKKKGKESKDKPRTVEGELVDEDGDEIDANKDRERQERQAQQTAIQTSEKTKEMASKMDEAVDILRSSQRYHKQTSEDISDIKEILFKSFEIQNKKDSDKKKDSSSDEDIDEEHVERVRKAMHRMVKKSNRSNRGTSNSSYTSTVSVSLSRN